MSRQDDFIEAGIEYRFKQGKPMAIGGDNFAEMIREANRNRVYEDGAEYGYQYAVEKTCEFIQRLLDSYNLISIKDGDYRNTVWLEEQFRKAMEE